MSDLNSFFSGNPDFTFQDNVFHQNSLPKQSFEKIYRNVRLKEGRVYSDEIVRHLPAVPPNSPHYREWKIRKTTAVNFCSYLQSKSNIQTIMELGCGNGWLTHFIYENTNIPAYGMDVNDTELTQAGKLFFKQGKACFVHADIFSPSIDHLKTDLILMAASIAYFANLEKLIFRLNSLLNEHGEIHITDSPLYLDHQLEGAKRRSTEYFRKTGHPEMISYYSHHSWKVLSNIKHQVIYNPHRWSSKLKRMLRGDLSPFPWIVIKRFNALH